MPAVVLLAACSSGEESATSTVVPAVTTAAATPTTLPTTTTPTPSTSTMPPPTAPPTTIAAIDPTLLSQPGIYPVGVTTLTLPTGNLVEVWYPAAEGATGSDAYDMRDYVPEAIRALLTTDVPATYTSPAVRDSAPADGRFPVVAYSHGLASIRVASTFLTAHLASWGFVVVAPDHPARNLASQLGGATENPPEPADDLRDAIAIVTDPAIGGDVAAIADVDQLALIGHSAGGGTILTVAGDPGVDGYVSMASGRLGDADVSMPDVPSLFLAGEVDAVVPPEERTRPAFEAAPSPSTYMLLDGVGHNGFDDFCTLGGGTGIIGLAEASGLGALLDAQPEFRTLGEDGCVPPARPVGESFPVIRHAVTAWLLALFGTAGEVPVVLDETVGDRYGVPVTVELR
jgi:predicted dienelactone hydrolase